MPSRGTGGGVGPAGGHRRQGLLKAKLRGLARTQWPEAVDRARDGVFPGGAAFVAGDTAAVLAEDDASRALGPALAWTRKAGAAQLRLLAPADAAGTLARRAAFFSVDVAVWAIDKATLVEAAPSSLPEIGEPRPDAIALAAVFARAGAETVWEDGMLRAEVLGLEVARIITHGGPARLEVGVGKHDREAQREVHGDQQGLDQLFGAVRIVAEHRRPGQEGHDAYHLATERWLRDVVRRRPEIAGLGGATLAAVPATVVRDDLRRAAPAPLVGTDAEGEPLVVVCSAGLDLDVMSTVADVHARTNIPDARPVVVVPEPDAYPVIADLATLHRPPVRLVTVPADWRSH